LCVQFIQQKSSVFEFLFLPNSSDSIEVHFTKGVLYSSDAVLFIVKSLPYPYKFLTVLRIISKRARDMLHRWIAKKDIVYTKI
tara:strand:+ start:667 stop:915 length:249 start_codon:yes stop_codon:yes gene_type:complete